MLGDSLAPGRGHERPQGHLNIAVTFAGLQLVLIQDEDVIALGGNDLKDLLRLEAFCRGKQRSKNVTLSMWSSCGLVKSSAIKRSAAAWS
jgi:hypothetical protein